MAQKKTIITISGSIGSGKTSAANRVAELLGYQRFSAGNVMRKMAADRGVTLGELTAEAVHNPAIDTEIDNALRAAGEGAKLVIDSRLGFHFIPDSFKVHIHLPQSVAVERIWQDTQSNPDRAVEHTQSRTDLAEAIAFRTNAERRRYEELYGVTVDNPDQFDLCISSEILNLKQVSQAIVDAYRAWSENS